MQYITENRQTPVRTECDVLVCGGGTAGIVAALAAARRGANTVLVERNGFLGGTMINGAGPLHSFFNMYKVHGVPKLQVIRGIPSEIVDRLTAAGGCYGHLEQEIGYDYDSVATIIDWEIFKDLIFKMMQESGVKMMLHTLIADTVMDGDTVRGVIVESKSGREAILAKSVVDCTGDGDVAFRAGAPFENKFGDSQVGMPFGMTDVDITRAVAFFEEKNLIYNMIHHEKPGGADNVIRFGVQLSKLPEFAEFMHKTGMWGPLGIARYENDFSYINTANLRQVNAVDVAEATRAEVELRAQVMEMASMLKQYIPGFEKAYVSWTPVHFGVRRTRIFECGYDVSIDDIVGAKRFDDEVAVFSFQDTGSKNGVANGAYYGLPYRALVPVKTENLILAGRMITSDWNAHMSTRNTVSCMAQGQAAGTAAALCSKQGISPHDINIKELQSALLQDGVYLGE